MNNTFVPRIVACLALVVSLAAAPGLAASDSILLYTATTTTTPQMGLWSAINNGWAKDRKLEVVFWKNLDDLRAAMLAGKGDIWVGHLEGFAQAASRGAPVSLLAVTGWRKFVFVGPADTPEKDIPALAARMREGREYLAVTPQDSPAIPLLEDLAGRGGPSFSLAAMPPQQAMLEMLRGKRRFALLPEPLASSLLAKDKKLGPLFQLEDEYARLTGAPDRLPLVGIAINTRFAEQEAERVRALLEAMLAAAPGLDRDADAALAVLPQMVRDSLGDAVIRASLDRDRVDTRAAWQSVDEIAAFLRIVLSYSKTDTQDLDSLLEGAFIWRPEQ